MGCGGYGDVRSEHDLVAYIDMTVVDQSQVGVCVDALAEMDVMTAPVRVEGKLDITAFSALGKDLVHICLFFLNIGGSELIERPELILIGHLLAHDLLDAGVVDLAPHHLLIFSHLFSSFR